MCSFRFLGKGILWIDKGSYLTPGDRGHMQAQPRAPWKPFPTLNWAQPLLKLLEFRKDGGPLELAASTYKGLAHLPCRLTHNQLPAGL